MPKKLAQQQIITQLTRQNATLRSKLLARDPDSKMPPVEADVRMTNNTTMRNGEKGRRARAIERLKQEQTQLKELLQQQELVPQQRKQVLQQELITLETESLSDGSWVEATENDLQQQSMQDKSSNIEQPFTLLQQHKIFLQQELIKLETENLINESWVEATENDLQQQSMQDKSSNIEQPSTLLQQHKIFLQQELIKLETENLSNESWVEATENDLQQEHENRLVDLAKIYLQLNQLINGQITQKYEAERKENEQLKTQINNQAQERAKILTENEILKSGNASYRIEIARLNSQPNIDIASLQTLEYSNAQLKAQLEKTQESHVQLFTKNEGLEIGIERKANALLALQFANADLSETNNQLLNQTKDQQQEIERLRTLLTQSQQTVSESEIVISTTLTENDKLRAKNKELSKQLEAGHIALAESLSKSESLLINEQKINQYLSFELKNKEDQISQINTKLDKIDNESLSSAINLSLSSGTFNQGNDNVPNPDKASIEILAGKGSSLPFFGPKNKPEIECDNSNFQSPTATFTFK